MAQIIVRNIDDALKQKLRIRADHEGHSMEEEVRRILSCALAEKPQGLGSEISEYFRGIDDEFDAHELKGQDLRPADLSE